MGRPGHAHRPRPPAAPRDRPRVTSVATPALDDALAAVLFLGITLYGVTGGADFGAGIWNLLAVEDVHGTGARAVIDRAFTPVWEANHVWLVFDLVILWTAFPTAFAAVMTTLWVPMVIALFGIVLRGSAFAFHKELQRLRHKQLTGLVFAVSSLITPFFFGAALGAIAAGRVHATGSSGLISSWTTGFSVLTGSLFVAACSFISAVYLCTDAEKQGRPEYRSYFTGRATASGLATGAIALGVLWDLLPTDQRMFDNLTGRALPLVVASGVAGLTAIAQLARGRAFGTRPLAAGAFALVIWGWGWAQYPELLATSLPLRAGSAPRGSMVALLVVFGLAVALVVPSFVLLYHLAQRQVLIDDERDVVAADLPSFSERSSPNPQRPEQ